MNSLEWWTENFGEYAPAGFVLRNQLKNNWLRVHSLPDSKRYPESPSDLEVLIQRHEELTDFMFQPGETCILFKSTRFWPEDVGSDLPSLSGFELSNTHLILAQYPGEIPIDQDDLYSVRYAPISWRPPSFTSLVKAVANEETYGVAVVSLNTKNIYCPYDGGADIFVFNHSPEKIRNHFKKWLSSRADFL